MRTPRRSDLPGADKRLPAKAQAALRAALVDLILDDEEADYGGDIDQPLPEPAAVDGRPAARESRTRRRSRRSEP